MAHRRLGKTVAVVNDLISRASYLERDDGRYAYIAPFYGQAKRIAWGYFKQYAGPLSRKISESELSITLRHNNAVLALYGADNPDSFRGQYFDGVDLDEYGNMKPSIWSEVILPTLIDRQGWATFIGTPNGPNHFRDQRLRAVADPNRWYTDLLPVSRTQHIPLVELLEMKELMSEEEYLQEMECSFEASTRGAFYAREIAEAITSGRVTPSDSQTDLPLHFAFDLGFTDDTSIGAFQEHPDGVHIVHAEDNNGRATAFYLNRISEICSMYGCARGRVHLPHDARAKTMQTGISIMEQFLAAGIRPEIVPNLDILDGISATRHIFKYLRFNEPSTTRLVLAIKSYHREYDEDKAAFSDNPFHDWASHPCDMLRYLALSARFPVGQYAPEPVPPPPLRDLKNYPFSLNELWEQNDGIFRDRIG